MNSSTASSSSSSNNMSSVQKVAIKIENIGFYQLDFSPDGIESARTLADIIDSETESRYNSNFAQLVNTHIEESNAKGFGPQSLAIRTYGQIVSDDKKSESFLKENLDLLTEESIQVLTDWCLSEEVDSNFLSMDNLLKQTMIIKGIVHLMNTTGKDTTTCIESFFRRFRPNTFYKNQFDHDLEAFHQEIRDRALAIGQKIDKEDEEEKYLIANGYDQNIVKQMLPEDLKVVVNMRDVQKLKLVLATMSKEEAEKHLTRCCKSGILTAKLDVNIQQEK